MAKKQKKMKARKKAITFFGHEVFLTFVGSITMGLGAMLAATDLQPLLMTWILASMIIWLGLLIFLYPIIKKIEHLHS